MSLNVKRIFKTVKFRIAVWYSLLFLFSALASLAVISSLMRNSFNRAMDRDLQSEAHDLELEYAIGKRFRSFQREVPPAEIPPEILTAVRHKFPDLHLVLAFENRIGEERFITLFGAVNGRFLELRLERSGKIYSKEVHIANHRPALIRAFEEMASRYGRDNVSYLLTDAKGQKLIASFGAEWLAHPQPPFPSGAAYLTAKAGEVQYRIIRLKLFDGGTLLIARNTHQSQEFLHQYSLYHLFGFLLISAAGLLFSWLIARKFVAGVLRVSATARKMCNGDFSLRVPSGNEGAEIDELVETFNGMNANTERLFHELKTVTDDVAHDLRTPITRMRGLAEVTYAGNSDIKQYQEFAGIVVEECGHMLQLINTMLDIARTESGIAALQRETLSLDELLRQAHELFLPLAEDNHTDFQLELPDLPLTVDGDRLKLQRVFSNLIDNALKFTPQGGKVTICATVKDHQIHVEVRDTGCGIPANELPRIFDRFFRCDASRTRPGNGLGLSLVRAIVIAHGGKIEAQSEPGKGSVFLVQLPQA